MSDNFELSKGEWLYKPERCSVDNEKMIIYTDPQTDFWQRSYYGFQNDNAPAFLFETTDNFTFSCMVEFDYQQRFDQAGLIMYLDSDNWFKASIEHEDVSYGRLGSVVTNLGYSDWATKDIEHTGMIWYRLSRRGADFLLEFSFEGTSYQQLRVFHLHALGDTDMVKAKETFYTGVEKPVRFGLYACSPLESSFRGGVYRL